MNLVLTGHSWQEHNMNKTDPDDVIEWLLVRRQLWQDCIKPIFTMDNDSGRIQTNAKAGQTCSPRLGQEHAC